VDVNQIIAEFKTLSPEQKAEVLKAILEDDSWIPESFRQGMEDIEKGRTVSMEIALNQKPPARVR
jgi:hypothetical protein